MSPLTSLALAMGLTLVLAACNTMGGNATGDVMDDEQNPGAQPADPNAGSIR